MKAIVIGRHTGQIPGYEILERKNITFPATSEECSPILEGLLQEAYAKEAALLFQALPGQMTAAFVKNIANNGPITHIFVGVIVSKPGVRKEAQSITFDHTLFNVEAIDKLVKFCNPNAKIDGFNITVEAPMEFVFSHVEPLNGG